MAATSEEPARHPLTWWTHAWRVATGTLLGTGLASASSTRGITVTFLMWAGLAFFLAVVCHGVLVEPGADDLRGRWLGPAAALVVVSLIGLVDLLPSLALPLGGLVAVTSPPLEHRLLGRRASHAPGTTTPHAPAGSTTGASASGTACLAQTQVDRAFEEIVAGVLRDDGDPRGP